MSGNVLPWWSNLWCMQQTKPFALDTETLSALEILNKLVRAVDYLINDEQSTVQQIEELKRRVEELDQMLKDWSEGKFDDVIKDEVGKWVVDNVNYIFETFCKQVFFGLTDDGYFCAYVPRSWSEITFDTGAIYGTPEYGRLILRFAADGQGVIQNDYDYKALQEAVKSQVELEAGDGLKVVDGKVNVDVGNGLSINPQTKMLEVPIGENLRYTSNGIDVPFADEITAGAVKLAHEVNANQTENTAVSPDGVFAYVEMKHKE